LSSGNTDLLHWDNFKGTYTQIFNRYVNYLAVIYNNYIEGRIEVKGNENPRFMKIIETAFEEGKTRYRNKDKKLKTQETYNRDMLNYFNFKIKNYLTLKDRDEMNYEDNSLFKTSFDFE
jgi:hypothetical protein